MSDADTSRGLLAPSASPDTSPALLGVITQPTSPAQTSLDVQHGGTLEGTEGAINMVDANGVTWTVTDDPTNDVVDIEVGLDATQALPSSPADGDIAVWDSASSSWQKSSSPKRPSVASLGSGTADATVFLRGDGAWATAGKLVVIDDLTVTGSVLASYDTNARLGGNIPQTYKDLILVVENAISNQASNQQVLVAVNADATATHYYWQHMLAAAASVAASENVGTTGSLFIGRATRSAGNGGMIECRFGNYSVSQTTHQFLSDYSMMDNNASGAIFRGSMGGAYASGVAHTITRLVVSLGTGSFAIGTRFTLYGRG